jgi:hypothetical protein
MSSSSVLRTYTAGNKLTQEEALLRHGDGYKKLITVGMKKPYNAKKVYDNWKNYLENNYDDEEEFDAKSLLLFDITENENSVRDSITGCFSMVPPEYSQETLKVASIAALNTMMGSILCSSGSHVHYHNLYRLLKLISKGTYGSVFSAGMREPTSDRRILTMLLKATIDDDYRAIWSYMSTLPKLVAVKVEETSGHYTEAIEFAIGREVGASLFPLGIHSCPAYYTLASLEANNVVPPPSDYQYESYSLFIGRPVSRGTGTATYQEYIDGNTLGDTKLNTNLLTAIIAYIHGILSYLYNRIGLVHSDLHWNNIILRKGKASYNLPILMPDGSAKFYISLPYEPVIIDFGLARTNNFATYSVVNSPRSTEMNDIIALYADKKPKTLPGYSYIEEKIRQEMPLSTIKYLPGDFIFENPITHEEMLNFYIDNGYLDEYITMSSPEPRNGLSLYSRDRTEDWQIYELAESLKEHASSQRGDIARVVKLYAEETMAFYQ